MSIIEEIKRDVRHDDGCAVITHGVVQKVWERSGRCNCSRRRKIAWLERLEEPTLEMVRAGAEDLIGEEMVRRGMAVSAFKEMLKAAEEDLP